jgi:hypothetical protein
MDFGPARATPLPYYFGSSGPVSILLSDFQFEFDDFCSRHQTALLPINPMHLIGPGSLARSPDIQTCLDHQSFLTEGALNPPAVLAAVL